MTKRNPIQTHSTQLDLESLRAVTGGDVLTDVGKLAKQIVTIAPLPTSPGPAYHPGMILGL